MSSSLRLAATVVGVSGVLAIAGLALGARGSLAPGVDSGTGSPPRLAIAGGPDSCGDNDHVERQGGTAGTVAKVCQGGGLVFIGPAVGQVAAVIGPTVIGPAQVGAIVSAGDAIMGF
jgi:hypothetical protein